MKYFLKNIRLSIFAVLFGTSVWAQNSNPTGRIHCILDADTKEPVAYANVGVVDKSLGTVSDADGTFVMEVPEDLMQDILRISALGYSPFEVSVAEWMEYSDTVYLIPAPLRLHEAIVRPSDRRLRHRHIGNRSGGGLFAAVADGKNGAGIGIAVPFTVKKQAWVEDVSFSISERPDMLSKMKFRVNFYEKIGEDDFRATAIPSVYFNYSKEEIQDGRFTFAFPEPVYLDRGDYYLELEFLENFPEETFIMKSSSLSPVRYRYASQTTWKKIPFSNTVAFGVVMVK